MMPCRRCFARTASTSYNKNRTAQGAGRRLIQAESIVSGQGDAVVAKQTCTGRDCSLNTITPAVFDLRGV
jgi:hypothetical protein